jgi:hypothetical protein
LLASAFIARGLAAMREHVPFKDFSNGFIWANKPDCLLQMEATTLKMREVERLNDTEDRLANNCASLQSSVKVKEGSDYRWLNLHPQQFFTGPGCLQRNYS